MKFLLVAINAKYIHSNLGVYSLKAYASREAEKSGVKLEIAEYTINQQTDEILRDIYLRGPDAVGFSCYIWNIRHAVDVARDLSRVLPCVHIWLGGPEVSYNAPKLLDENPWLTGVIKGEGEETFREIIRLYGGRTRDFWRLGGLVTRTPAGAVVESWDRAFVDLDNVPFPYGDLEDFENRIIYYESSRGCPFSCSYCLSSIEKAVRFRQLSLVMSELNFFLRNMVSQVKFVDRTFNCQKERAEAIWRYLLDHDNGVTNFHFEISADLLTEGQLDLLGRMRPGLVQLEIGVQTVNPRTIGEIDRNMDLEKLRSNLARIQGHHNIHQHLDLIAGLPFEDYESFARSFNAVYEMEPDQLQLGFLKVLKGSRMAHMANAYGLRYGSAPPYEVLSTRWMTYGDILRLKSVEEVVEVYYNSGQFVNVMKDLSENFSSPFAMYEALAGYYGEKGLFGVSHNRLARYEILYEFIRSLFTGADKRFRALLTYDLYLRENVKSRPQFALDQTSFKKKIRGFFEEEKRLPRYLTGYEEYDARQMSKMAHLEVLEDGRVFLFDYRDRDPLTHNARATEIRL